MDATDKMVMARAEYDITNQITVFAAIGEHKYRSRRIDLTPYGVNTAGYYTASLTTGRYKYNMGSGEVGLRAHFATASIEHRLNISATMFRSNEWERGVVGSSAPSNIYRPIKLVAPPVPEIPHTAEKNLNSYGIADTIVVWDERVMITLGLRHQQVSVDSVWENGAYNEWKTSPVLGIVVKPQRNISIYANYIEGLNKGPIAPVDTGLDNAGEVFPPYTAKQYEVGAKGEWNGFGASVSLFQISRPNSLIENNLFTVEGEQRNRGLEWIFYGTPVQGVRVLGGVVLLDAKVTKSAGVAQGKDAAGIPKRQLNLGAEWDTPFLSDLTLTARVLYTSSIFINSENTISIPGWTRWDAGARYNTRLGGKPITLRATIENISGEDYWVGHIWGGAVGRSGPRTFTLGATVDF